MSDNVGPRKGLAGDVRRGLLWSTANSMVLRLANLVLGMVLARLLVPADFGVFAVALAVQSILLTLADLGLSADLVRSANPAERAPTLATISLLSGIVLALAMALSAGPVADAMREPRATPVLAVLAATLIVSGAGIVPYAHLQREFEQRKLFVCAALDFATYTGITIALVLLGLGPMALAVARVLAQAVDTGMQFVLSGIRPRFGFQRPIARSALAYGLPLAGANLLSFALLNIDNTVIARVAGAAPLGLYVLAFNISSWPMSTIGQAVRSVSLAGFSHSRQAGDRSLLNALSLSWAVAVPIGVMLAALAHPVVVLLYGTRWTASATVLAALGMFGALRVAFDLVATYLMARGAARAVLCVQLIWFLGLIPPMVLATRWFGIAGAGWSHLAVGVAVIVPAYVFALTRSGTRIASLAHAVWLPTLACVPTWYVAHSVAAYLHHSLEALACGGAAGTIVYVGLCYRWLRALQRRVSERQSPPVLLVEEAPALNRAA